MCWGCSRAASERPSRRQAWQVTRVPAMGRLPQEFECGHRLGSPCSARVHGPRRKRQGAETARLTARKPRRARAGGPIQVSAPVGLRWDGGCSKDVPPPGERPTAAWSLIERCRSSANLVSVVFPRNWRPLARAPSGGPGGAWLRNLGLAQTHRSPPWPTTSGCTHVLSPIADPRRPALACVGLIQATPWASTQLFGNEPIHAV